MKIFTIIERNYDNLSPREQKMIVATVISSLFLICGFFIFLVSDSFMERELRIKNLKNALNLMYKNRGKVEEARTLMASYEMKAVKKPPMLQGHIDTLAQTLELTGLNYNPKKPKDLGETKEYHQESVEVKLVDVDLKKISLLMDKIEKGQHLLMVTELTVTARRSHHDRLDGTLVVSSFFKRSAAELKEISDKKKKESASKKKKKTEK
ncbi:hypothetical protein KKF34_13010 [Myxococcota bacterium]|nr:hypothetical protein [Myxococcota bacterium]MBU1381886.1 hypothetical protein [Myxococcota bacterium]MBU1497787.1 hypothetical protein [Myxococcota bacterium]